MLGGVDDFVYSLAIDLINPMIVYAGTFDRGVFKTLDGGDHWVQASGNLGNIRVESIATDPARSGSVYLGTGWQGVFVYTFR